MLVKEADLNGIYSRNI